MTDTCIRPPQLPHQRDLLPAYLHDHQVLTFKQWCKLNSFSQRTGRRILAAADAPVVTRLSPRRIGITVGNNRAWQQARQRASAVTASCDCKSSAGTAS